jgi:aminopeptidase N
VSLTYASDDGVQLSGVAIDDIVVSTGEGSTSFEADDDPLDGWIVTGPPADSPGNYSDWRTGTRIDLPRPAGEAAAAAFARQPLIIDFLAEYFGEYPFRSGGGIVDVTGQHFSLENQTRPIYGLDIFGSSAVAEVIIVHELAHQWFGDDLRLGLWQDIWLNEGFATYAQWLWNEDRGLGTAQENFDFLMTEVPAEDAFWSTIVGDPGREQLFADAVYERGAMTLHALRLEVGDDDFFGILRSWADSQSGDTVSTSEFVQLAEQVSGDELDDLFEAWLYTPARPDVTG